MLVKVSPPLTATGIVVVRLVPLPSAPDELSPQQYATPAAVKAQLWRFPALSFVKVSSPETGTGTLESLVPLPSSLY
jgi:hypothetical protein